MLSKKEYITFTYFTGIEGGHLSPDAIFTQVQHDGLSKTNLSKFVCIVSPAIFKKISFLR